MTALAVVPIAPAVPADEWVWYGYAGHLIVGKNCAYHMATRVGGYFVSTVGHYLPRGKDQMETIGAGEDAFFETMVFPVDGEEPSGDPNITDWTSIECIRYATSIEAERSHRALCRKYASLA